MTADLAPDHQSESLQAFLDAHPVELTDAEKRIHDRARDVPDWLQIKSEIRRSGEDY